ncbi:capsular biosynthesis protein, partial [Salmonella enterica]|nr:capsular biosynthesis protein [Salmonella enterica]
FYKEQGYTITIFTARNMKTFSGNLGKINIHTLPIIIEWLNKNDVPFDEVIVGKPWCGTEGFYVDDRAIRPSEFINLSEKEIKDILGMEERNDHN